MLRVIEYFAKLLKVIQNDTLEKDISPYQYFVVKHVRISYRFGDRLLGVK